MNTIIVLDILVHLW